MPQKDGTGPQGNGPKTGRGMGNCAPQAEKKDQSKDVQGMQFSRRGQGQGQGQDQSQSQGRGGAGRGKGMNRTQGNR